MSQKRVLIAGGTGLVGLAAAQHFASLPDCQVTTLGRREMEPAASVRHLRVDLTDKAACMRLRNTLADTTHVVYAAVYEEPQLVAGWRGEHHVAVNDLMFRNLWQMVDTRSARLEHVSLVEGTKAYGIHVRPMKIPAREGRDDARDVKIHYWPQEELLRGLARTSTWGWTIFRPQLIIGGAFGHPMSLIPALGVYGALLKSDALPLYHPGRRTPIHECTDADLLAHAIAWSGESPAARNQVFNITNGDVFTWEDVWPAVAAALGMEPGEFRPVCLADSMPERAADWDRIRERHDLLSPSIQEFVGTAFQYVDDCLGFASGSRATPALVSSIRLREAGFCEIMDTERMFCKWFRVMQRERLLPPP